MSTCISPSIAHLCRKVKVGKENRVTALPGCRAAELLAVDGYLLLLKYIQYTMPLLDEGLLQKVSTESGEQPFECMRRGIAICVRKQAELPGLADFLNSVLIFDYSDAVALPLAFICKKI